MIDPKFMQMAISLAGQAKGFTSPNPCVGAVVVKDGRIVGKGFHRAAGLPHAEPEAIDDAGKSAENATIYVTLEPCNHFGKTPPCTRKILDAGITKVVVGCKDPNPYVSGGGIDYLRQQGVEVVEGVLEEECSALIEDFIWYIKSGKKPFVILKCASTLDGAIATSTGDSQWITGEAARRHGHRLRHEADAILIGSGTLHADNPSLTARIDGVKTKDPARIILDTHLTINEDAKLLTLSSQAPTIIVTGPDAPADKRARLEDKGATVLEVPLKDGRLDLQQLMITLGQMSVVNLLIEGGGTVAGAALDAGIVNKMMYFMAPKIIGGSDGIPVFKGKGVKRIKDLFALKNVDILRFENDFLIKGYLK
jgi:diaminohydroxyphosphoribosylaminopyrimidine deaminase/5-amino-6-(5-phosphoribosylamino)uracil reductase